MFDSIIRKGICFVLSFVLIFSLSGCDRTENATVQTNPLPTSVITDVSPDGFRTYSTEVFEITLPDDFWEERMDNGGIAFYNGYVIVMFGSEWFIDNPALQEYSLAEYGEYLIACNNLDTQLQQYNDLHWCELQNVNPENNTLLSSIVTFHRNDDAFWFFEFMCDSREIERHRTEYLEWAMSVEFIE